MLQITGQNYNFPLLFDILLHELEKIHFLVDHSATFSNYSARRLIESLWASIKVITITERFN